MQLDAQTFTIGFLAGIALFAVVWFVIKRNRSGKDGTESKNLVALNQWELQRNLDNVIKELNELCKEDENLRQAYFILGNLYRLNGEPQRSLMIHQNLLAERKLPNTMNDRLHLEIANDLMELGAEDKAFAKLKEVSDKSPLFFPAQEKMIQIFLARSDFEHAYECLDKILRRRRTWRNRKRAAYFLCMLAAKHLESGNKSEAKPLVRQALGHDQQCVYAHLLQGDILMEDKSYQQAIKSYEQAIHENAEYSFLAVPRIENAYYSMQSFMKFGETIERLCAEHPRNNYLGYALGKYYRKCKQYNEARRLLKENVSQHALSILTYDEMLRLNEEEDNNTESIQKLSSLLDDLKASAAYHCQHCHFEHSELVWICNSCGRLETVVADYSIRAERPSKKADLQSATGRL